MSALLSPAPTASRWRVQLPLYRGPSETTRRPSVAAHRTLQIRQHAESPDSPHSSGRCYAHVPKHVTLRPAALTSVASANRGTPVPVPRTETRAASTSTTSRGAAPHALARSRSRGTSSTGWHRPTPATPPRSACFCLVLSRLFPLRLFRAKLLNIGQNTKRFALFFYYLTLCTLCIEKKVVSLHRETRLVCCNLLRLMK